MGQKSGILLLALLIMILDAFPQVTDTSSFIISSTTPSGIELTKEIKNDQDIIPKIYEMIIESNVSNRFAKTMITSKVKNFNKVAHEVVFEVIIPDQALISGFIMEIDGKSYEAHVDEKEKAKNTYKAAVANRQAAGYIGVNVRDSNRFKVSLNIEPQSKVTFYLKYEELLKRNDEKYQIVINIHPGQPVKHLETKVNIAESRPIKFVKTPSLKTGNEITKEDEKLNPNAKIDIINMTSAVVVFSPNIEKQKQYANILGTNEKDGFAGQFIVEYDVERDPQGGEVLVDNGYFVHFFAPKNVPSLPKQVVFVLDTSGSMEGIRITQLKEAMRSILSELKEDDLFNLVEFNSISKVWNVEAEAVQYESGRSYWNGEYEDKENPFKNRTEQPLPPSYPATKENIKKAEDILNKLIALGGTDIHTALKLGIQLIHKNLKNDKKHLPIIMFLTDGEPTVGETFTDKIIRTVSELNSDKIPIFSLSFGDGADRKFLEKLSLKNFGFARHIYEAADASLQLSEFFKQISSPLLSNVTFRYVSNVTEVTKRHFPILFGGSELIVAGIADPSFQPPKVEGWGINGPVILIPKVETAVSSLERLWAYLTLKQILEQREQADDKTGPTQEALRLALKYSFVSDVTSLVVVKPNTTNTVETEDGSKNDKFYPILPGGAQAPVVPYTSNAFALNGGLSTPLPTSYYRSIAQRNYFRSSAQSLPDISLLAKHLSTTFDRDRLDVPTTEINEALLINDMEELMSNMPWLESILSGNYTIRLSSGTYELGLNASLSTEPRCTNSLSNTPGNCVILSKCPQIFTHIRDQTSYEKYFCNLEGYAGICCPKTKQSTKN